MIIECCTNTRRPPSERSTRSLAQSTRSTSQLSQPRASKQPPSSPATSSTSAATSFSHSRSSFQSQSQRQEHQSQSAPVAPEADAVEHQFAEVVEAVSPVVHHEEEREAASAPVDVEDSLPVAPAEAVASRGEHQEDVVSVAEEGVRGIVNLRVPGKMGVLVTCLFQGSVYNNHSCHRGLASVMSNHIIEQRNRIGYY